MAFTVEDGTGVSGANAYITVAYADAYHGDRGNAAWTGADELKQQAIIRATDYIETRWGETFLGTPEHTDPLQPLSFPRLGIYNRAAQEVTGIPEALKRATAEYAMRALSAALMPDPSINATGVVVGVREKVGPLETETMYSGFLRNATLRAYPAADRLLAPLLAGGGRGRVYR